MKPAATATKPVKTPKASSRVALVHLAPELSAILTDCFKQFNIQTVPVEGVATAQLWKQKFEGCVMNLDENSEPVLKAARNSPSNKHMIIYGIAKDVRSAMNFSKYGVNALFYEPVDRASALKVV